MTCMRYSVLRSAVNGFISGRSSRREVIWAWGSCGSDWRLDYLPVIWQKYSDGDCMDTELILRNNLKQARQEKKLSQSELAKLVGVSRQTICSIETGVFNPTAKLALILCIALDKKFEDLFYF